MTTLWLSPLNGDPAFGDALVPRLLAAHAMLPPDGVRDALVPLLAASFDARPATDDDDVARRRRSFERRLVRPVLVHVERRVRAREREGALSRASDPREGHGGGSRRDGRGARVGGASRGERVVRGAGREAKPSSRRAPSTARRSAIV